MGDKIVVEDVYKIFGPRPEVARRMIGEGWDKDDIFDQTGNTVGVQQASFSIGEGESFVIMGLSGSGKSTMVRLLNRLIEPTSGTIRVDDQDITAMSRAELIRLRRIDMSMVFQSFALMPHQSVLQNAMFGLEVSGSLASRQQRRERALEALEQVGLRANAYSYPDELSGGMKQRVGLARALAVNPSILLMDEAFSALDPLIRTQMQDELIDLQRQQQRTIVFISHDLDEAMRIGDRIAIMEQGRVVQIGTPQEIVTQPANDYVRSFFQGVDVTRVFSAGDIAVDTAVPMADPATSSAASLREQIAGSGGGAVALVDATGRYQGMATSASLDSGGQRGDVADPEVQPLAADRALSGLVGPVAAAPWPVPVVDAAGCYLGAITKTALLQTLNRGE